MPTPSRSIANSSTAIPGRPSGVSAGASTRSIAASHLQPITEVAKPVIERAASRAQRRFAAVITSRAHAHRERLGERVVDLGGAERDSVMRRLHDRDRLAQRRVADRVVLERHRVAVAEQRLEPDRARRRRTPARLDSSAAVRTRRRSPSSTTSSPALITYRGVANISSRSARSW